MNQKDLAYKHFLITRYNVPLAGWEKDRRGVSTRDESWLLHRQGLFTKYCLPTVHAQSEKNFIWLIYCDKETPPRFLDEIQKSINQIEQAEIRLVSDYFDCMNNIDQELTACTTPFVITSRLDNDDGLGIEYMSIVQSHFIPEDKTIINLLNGNGYNMTHQVATTLRNIRKNHFGSLIEARNDKGGHISVRGFQHGSPPANFRVINLLTKHSWLKIFHERNLKSSTFGYPLLDSNFYKFYGIEKNNSQINYQNSIIYFFWWLHDGVKRKIFTSKRKQ